MRISNVSKSFQRGSGPVVNAVDDVSLAVDTGETVALIGESGSGKSTLGRLALRLLDADVGGVEFEGRDLRALGRRELRSLRSRMTVVFQEPYESLNPRMHVGAIVEEPLVLHERGLNRLERRERVGDTLARVGLTAAHAEKLPHELSGGQQQRIGIARAIVTRPSFVVLDEPTSSLDLSVRAQILQLLTRLQQEFSLSYLFISHDIHTVEYISDRIAVMYLGKIVETGPTKQVFAEPQHPYTQALLSATLSADPSVKKPQLRLVGDPYAAASLTSGCFLYGRCPIGTTECRSAQVSLREIAPGHEVACIRAPLERLEAQQPERW